MTRTRTLVALAAAIAGSTAVVALLQSSVDAQKAVDCAVAKSFGDLRGSLDDWLIFEDDGGTIRTVDVHCRVGFTIRRE